MRESFLHAAALTQAAANHNCHETPGCEMKMNTLVLSLRPRGMRHLSFHVGATPLSCCPAKVTPPRKKSYMMTRSASRRHKGERISPNPPSKSGRVNLGLPRLGRRRRVPLGGGIGALVANQASSLAPSLFVRKNSAKNISVEISAKLEPSD